MNFDSKLESVLQVCMDIFNKLHIKTYFSVQAVEIEYVMYEKKNNT